MLVNVLCLVSLVSLATCNLHGEFSMWKEEHRRVYATKQEEYKRFALWLDSHHKIQAWNSNNTFGNARFGLGPFSDWSSEEFQAFSRGVLPVSSFPGLAQMKKANTDWSLLNSVNAPPTLDWRTKGAVTGVKNQGQCGSCWSFGSTGTLEGAHFLATGKLVSLSEQNLIDCSGKCCYNEGCNGGRVDWALTYVMQNNGIDTESSYPYKAEDETCSYNPSNIGSTCSNWTQTPFGNENALMNAVYLHGPTSVAISVDDAWANYKSGVYTDSSCPNGEDDLDHSVLVVGYGTEGGQDYWLVKNSWGGSWGAQGYIKMRRNYNNMCGVATDAVFGVVPKP